MLDRESNFKNQVVAVINGALHVHHHFTAPNNSHSNCTVERVCREVLRCCRALLSEFSIKENEWTLVLPIVQSVSNNKKLRSLGNHAPINVFSGLPVYNPLRLIVPPSSSKIMSTDEIRALKRLNVERLLDSLDGVHRDVAERRNTVREIAVKIHNEKTHVQKANISVDDFVLVAKRMAKDSHKLQVQWRGPQRTIRIDLEWVYECQDLINESCALVHANRLKFYADS